MLVSFALGDANFLRRPCTFLYFCVDFMCVGYPTRTPFPVEYRFRWVPGVGSLRWACTFNMRWVADANAVFSGIWALGFLGWVSH